MNQIVDKIILFCICFISFVFFTINLSTVSVVLIAITISSFCYYFQTSRMTIILVLFYYALCIWNPYFCIFLPLILYDAAQVRVKYLLIAGIFIFIPYWRANETFEIVISVFSSCLALLMNHRTKRYTKLQEEFKRLRDNSQELNMYLSKKNKMLIENQDYEIHLATLQERNRIAREIHDNVGHMLSRSLLQVGALMAIYKEEVISKNLWELKNTLNDAMNSIRESVHDLHDDSIDLQANIQNIMKEFMKYNIQLDYDVSEDMAKEVKYCFIMIIKEALSNTAKHSNADHIMIIVREHPVFYQLLIKDNGTGGSNQSDRGMGLENMSTRVRGLEGNISIDNSDGFKIFISIPKKERTR